MTSSWHHSRRLRPRTFPVHGVLVQCDSSDRGDDHRRGDHRGVGASGGARAQSDRLRPNGPGRMGRVVPRWACRPARVRLALPLLRRPRTRHRDRVHRSHRVCDRSAPPPAAPTIVLGMRLLRDQSPVSSSTTQSTITASRQAVAPSRSPTRASFPISSLLSGRAHVLPLPGASPLVRVPECARCKQRGLSSTRTSPLPQPDLRLHTTSTSSTSVHQTLNRGCAHN